MQQLFDSQSVAWVPVVHRGCEGESTSRGGIVSLACECSHEYRDLDRDVRRRLFVRVLR